MLKSCLVSILICFFHSYTIAQVNTPAVKSLIQRIVGNRSHDFLVDFIPQDHGRDVFEVQSRGNKILLGGNNGVSVASALYFYLKNYCHCLITWNGVNLALPGRLPAVKVKEHKSSPYKYRYYLNYCTFNYSMSWWDWGRWQKEIDWMALNGINMPLAISGEEAIWYQLYRKLGFSDSQLQQFFSGPGYFAWLWMGNLDKWDGPLSKHWIDTHKRLQIKILQKERSLGMQTVLPAFTGHVPASFIKKFPKSKVKKTNWGAGFDDVYILDPSDPLFDIIGKKFLDLQTNIYGTDHLYSADTFNENVPPQKDSLYLSDMSKKIFSTMSMIDHKAIWVMQGWMFHYNSSYWQPKQIQALLNAIPNDHMIILDLYSESFPMWKQTSAYYGKPWIWNMLHNFGGNISLWGRMDQVALGPSITFHDSLSGKMVGIGLTPEGIEQNPALYQLMLENIWREDTINLYSWLKQYIIERYGHYNASLNQAWQLLSSSVYKGGLTEGGPESIIVARPTFEKSIERVLTNLDYDSNQLISAWELFINAASSMKGSDGFQFDLVDITRQVLANYASPLQQHFVKAFNEKNYKAFQFYSRQFLILMDDMDKLLATRKEFLLGKWIADARENGTNQEEKDLYELNARNLITLWGSKESNLREYSNRQWAGLIRGFYRPRWKQFFSFLSDAMKSHAVVDFKKFENLMKDWEWNWVKSHEFYPHHPKGNPISISLELFKKYYWQIKKLYRDDTK